MRYAIIYTGDGTVAADAMIRAFHVLRSVTETDARILANDPYGILVEHLEDQDARQLSDSLMQEGIACELVDQNLVPDLQRPRLLRRAAVVEDGLVLFDLYGRPNTLPWPSIYLLAMGAVALTEESEHPYTHTDYRTSSTHGAFAFQSHPTLMELETHSKHLIELFVDGTPERYRIVADGFGYSALGDRQSLRYSDNFMTLAQDLREHALRLGSPKLNRGAAAFPERFDDLMPYPTEHAFEKELRWIMLRSRGSSRMRPLV